MSRPTIKEIARRAGVSYTTVSRALSGGKNVRPETAARILALCREAGYPAVHRPRGTATRTVGILLPDLAEPYACELARLLEAGVCTRGGRAVIMSAQGRYEAELENALFCLESGFDGIIVSCVGERSPQTLLSCAAQMPTLFLCRELPDVDVSCIAQGAQRSVELAARFLAGLGHRRLAFFAGQTASQNGAIRCEELRRAAGAECKVLPVAACTQEDGYAAAQEYFAHGGRATALIAPGDAFALGVMRAARERAFPIPGRVSLLSCGGSPAAALPGIDLTTAAPSEAALASAALTALFTMMADGNATRICQTLEPRLTQRATCAPPYAG